MTATLSTTGTTPTLEVGGILYPYRPDTWTGETIGRPLWGRPEYVNPATFQADTFKGDGWTAWAIYEEALSIQRDLDHETANLENVRRALATDAQARQSEAPTEEVKIERAARDSGATPEQLARLRALVTAERESIRQAREIESLRAEVNRLSNEGITKYDPRIEPMLRDLAELANERSFCSEFDLVLDHIESLLSREELAPQAQSGHVHVTITMEVTIGVDDIEDFDLDNEEIVSALRNGDIGQLLRDGSWETGNVCSD